MSKSDLRGGQTVMCPACQHQFKITQEDRFWGKVDRSGPNGCWVWTAQIYPNGYGCFTVRSRGHNRGSAMKLAHRWAYELLVGPIPDGLHLDHLCRNKACVNPHHLEPVTPRENVLRGMATSVVRRVVP